MISLRSFLCFLLVCGLVAMNVHAQPFAVPGGSQQSAEPSNAPPAPPAPTQAQVTKIFNDYFSQQLLFFKLKDLPAEIERTHKAKVKEMDKWVALGLLKKSKSRFKAEKIMYGSKRIVSVGSFKYELNDKSPWVGADGFFYGRPKMLKLLEVSPPRHVNTDFFSEAYVSWHVIDRPDWVAKVDKRSRANRMLKRAVNSKKQPFEKRIYLIYRDGLWRLWTERGEQTLFKS